MKDVEDRQSAADRQQSRRALLKKAAAATAVGWTVPMIIDGVTNPAAAATCAKGTFNVVYQILLAPIAPNGSCTATGTNTTPALLGLTAAFTGTNPTGGANSIAHVASTTGNSRAVILTIAAGCTCVITNVTAHVHRRGAPTSPDCPAPACQSPSPSATAPLRLIAGALNSATVTVQPNNTSVPLLCGNTGTHWGAPASAPGNNTERGYMVVQVSCT